MIYKKIHSPPCNWNRKLSKKIYKRQPLPQREPTQSMKSINIKGPFSINNLVAYHNKYTKEPFSLWMDNTSSSKAILFLTFQTVQKKHKGPTLQTFLRFLPTKNPFQLKRVSLTEEGNTHKTPKREKNTSHKALVFTQWRSKWSMDSSFEWQR